MNEEEIKDCCKPENFVYNEEEDYIFCRECGKRWGKETIKIEKEYIDKYIYPQINPYLQEWTPPPPVTYCSSST